MRSGWGVRAPLDSRAAALPDESIHEPWNEPLLARRYPRRIVQHEEQHAKAVAMFVQVKKS